MAAPVATPALSANTTKQYDSVINRLKQEELFPILAKHPKLVVSWINSDASKSGSIDTQNTYLNAILYHLRKTPGADLSVYTTESKRLQLLRNDKSKSQTLPPAKLESLEDWTAISNKEAEAAKLSKEEYLIYLLYTKMPPLRADFANLQIYMRDDAKRAGNYILGSKSLKKWRLVLNDYKTSKTFGRQVFALPEVVATQMKLVAGDSAYVLKGYTENWLGKQVTKVFEKLTAKKLSINLLRHAYIKHFLSKKRTIKEKEALAIKMLHSKNLQEQYDVIEEPGAGETA